MRLFAALLAGWAAAAAAQVTVEPKGGDGDDRPAGRRPAASPAPGASRPAASSAPAPPVVIKMRRQSVPAPRAVERSLMPTTPEDIRLPATDAQGRRVRVRAARPPDHGPVANDPGLLREIQARERVRIEPNSDAWLDHGGRRYRHHYDGRYHWWGFHFGPSFYWTRHHGGYWWWYDHPHARWTYWWGGHWWWPSPTGALYVYVDNTYYPYEESGIMVKKPEVQAPPDSVPPAGRGGSHVSPDKTRLVQVTDEGEAFLYDRSGPQPAFLKYLGKDVEKVRFSGKGERLRILLDFADGSFAVYDRAGTALDSED